jgi:hypothetical protein
MSSSNEIKLPNYRHKKLNISNKNIIEAEIGNIAILKIRPKDDIKVIGEAKEFYNLYNYYYKNKLLFEIFRNEPQIKDYFLKFNNYYVLKKQDNEYHMIDPFDKNFEKLILNKIKFNSIENRKKLYQIFLDIHIIIYYTYFHLFEEYFKKDTIIDKAIEKEKKIIPKNKDKKDTIIDKPIEKEKKIISKNKDKKPTNVKIKDENTKNSKKSSKSKLRVSGKVVIPEQLYEIDEKKSIIFIFDNNGFEVNKNDEKVEKKSKSNLKATIVSLKIDEKLKKIIETKLKNKYDEKIYVNYIETLQLLRKKGIYVPVLVEFNNKSYNPIKYELIKKEKIKNIKMVKPKDQPGNSPSTIESKFIKERIKEILDEKELDKSYLENIENGLYKFDTRNKLYTNLILNIKKKNIDGFNENRKKFSDITHLINENEDIINEAIEKYKSEKE